VADARRPEWILSMPGVLHHPSNSNTILKVRTAAATPEGS
jgi:hypothetical protein